MATIYWLLGDIIWTCRQCAKDPTCVQCDQCFRQADHTNHEVMILIIISINSSFMFIYHIHISINPSFISIFIYQSIFHIHSSYQSIISYLSIISTCLSIISIFNIHSFIYPFFLLGIFPSIFWWRQWLLWLWWCWSLV